MKATRLALVAVGASMATVVVSVNHAAAGEPFELSRAQLDHVTAGGDWTLTVSTVTPGTSHELTHVVQQRRSPADRREITVGVHQDGQIIVLRVGPLGGDSHDRFANIEVSYPLPAPGGR